ncbi:TetR/AcrR family transcriptional regulator [Glycomyces sp. MUSA5-2]|uniref:TetR/AcrR family transcriptional regulator n=1 Tax=Glycomyces sp. MUSA5-2 TaxID=2053002 RepID=UPI0030092CC5
MTFQRARTPQQRSERRRQILDTTAQMLTETTIANLSLNELSRRTGLAKSNVLRYFESREAILFELLDAELQDWLTALEGSLDGVEGTPRQRGDRFARAVAQSLAERPVLCDLLSAQSAVLEHNVTPQVSYEHKHATLRSFRILAGLARRCLPELGAEDAFRLTGFISLAASATWPYIQPSRALTAAYPNDPVVAAMDVDFADVVSQAVAVSISGLLARGEDIPLGARPLATIDAEADPEQHAAAAPH